MDEYIKREDALDAVLFALVGTGYQSRAIYAIRDVPTADVAPKSEVAREIFEEIDKEYGENCGAYRIDDLTYGQLWDFLAELKKKYTESIK